MLNSKPLKVGQVLIHDVLGRVVFTKKCMELQAKNTSKVLLYVDDGMEIKNVSKSCLHIMVADAAQSYFDELSGQELYQALKAEGLIECAAESGRPQMKEVVVSCCPACNSQDVITVDEHYPEEPPEHELCSECAKKYGEF